MEGQVKYPKIETLFERNPDKPFNVFIDMIRMEEFSIPQTWLVTEKIDGTNIRVVCTKDEVRFRGRTDNAQMPVFLLDRLIDMLPHEALCEAFFSEENDTHQVVLYGEGYGAKIQKGGGDYRAGVSFRLFDVLIVGEERNWWLNWDNVADVAKKLSIRTVPVISRDDTIGKAVARVEREGLRSDTATAESASQDNIRQAEGIVARTEPLLFTRRGDRVMWKLKASDFKL